MTSPAPILDTAPVLGTAPLSEATPTEMLGEPTTVKPLFKGVNLLNTSDQLWLGLCAAILLLSSLIAMFSTKEGINGFFLANRKLGVFRLASAMILSNLGSAQFVGIAGSASKHGVSIYITQLAATFTILLLGWIFLPVYIASGSLTTIDYIKKRLGSVLLEVFLALTTVTLALFTKISMEMLSINQVLTAFSPDSTYKYAVAFPILFLAMFVTLAGGLHGLANTCAAVFVFLLFGAGFVSFYCTQVFETFTEMKEKYFEAWPNTTRHNMEKEGGNNSYPYLRCGIPAATSWSLLRSYNNYYLPWPGMMFGVFITNLWYWCCDQTTVQIGLGAENIIKAKYACVITAYAKIVSILFLVMPGLVSRILHPDTVACADPSVCEQVCGSKYGCSNLAFPSIFLEVVPPGFRGVVLAAVIASSMSTITASLNSGSSIFTINIYRNIRPRATEIELLLVNKLAVIALGMGSLASAEFILGETHNVYEYIESSVSLTTPPVAAIFVCALFWDKVNEKCAFVSLLLGLSIALTRLLWSVKQEYLPCGQMQHSKVPEILENFHYLHFAIFLFVLCVSIIVIISVFSEPINIVHLYRLLYWLRHSKLDRVDIYELKVALRGKKRHHKHHYNVEGQEQEDMEAGQEAAEEESSSESDEEAGEAGKDGVWNRIMKMWNPGAGPEVKGDKDEKVPEEATDQAPPVTEPEVQETTFATKGRIAEAVNQNPVWTERLCCVKSSVALRRLTQAELRETVKQRASIEEEHRHQRVLNMHAVLLLIVTAVIWGYLS